MLWARAGARSSAAVACISSSCYLTAALLAPGVPPCCRNPEERLGAGPAGLAALKAHPWFAPINWQALLEHRWAAAA